MVNNITLAEQEKSSGRNWTEEEKDLVWEQVQNGKKDGLPLTQCFRKISGLLPHRSEAAIGMLYYNVLRKERDEQEILESAPTPIKRELKLDADLIEAFQGLPEYISKLHKRLDQIEQKTVNLSKESVINALVEIATNYQNQDSLKQLQAENKQLQEKLVKLEQAYEDALGIYDMFTNMASISQIMSLGDFKQQMKTTLDKWGNVLKVTFQRAEEH